MDSFCFDNSTCIYLAIFSKPRRINIPSRIVYKMLIASEIFILLGIFVFVTMIIRITWKSVLFHPNLRRMVTFLLAHAYLYIPCRIPLILYQERVFRLDLRDGAGPIEIILITSSILRLYHGLNTVFLYCATVIERVLASLYIHDYESKRRLHISIILRLSVVGISSFLALELTYDLLKLTYIVYLALIVGCSSISAVISFYLYFYNRYRLKHVLKRTDSYSLSLRYQLIENMRAFRFLQTITACGIVGILINCMLLAVPHVFLPGSSSVLALCGAAFDTDYAFTFFSGILLCFLSQPAWKRELAMQMRHFLKRSSDSKFVAFSSAASVRSLRVVPDAASAHFTELAKNWDIQLKKTRK